MTLCLRYYHRAVAYSTSGGDFTDWDQMLRMIPSPFLDQPWYIRVFDQCVWLFIEL